MRGREAVCACVAAVRQTFPGLVAIPERMVADGPDSVVVELRQVNPDAGTGDETWRLAGTVCDVLTVRAGRIAAIHSYYSAHPDDRTVVAPLPMRSEAHRLADEQDALRRVATLVAQGVSEEEVFGAVNEAIARIISADATSLFRFEPDDSLLLLAAWSRHDVPLPVGQRRPLGDQMRALRDRRAPVRFEVVPDGGPFAEEARALGIRSGVGVPIAVDGRPWGIVFASSERTGSFPATAEARIVRFGELVATAIANTQARAAVQQLADEQAALRRVAELVARAVSPEQVLEAVVVEASTLLGGAGMSLLRFGPDGDAVVVATHRETAPVGLLVPMGGAPCTELLRTRRPVRVRSFAGTAVEDLAGTYDAVAAVVVPVMVDGRVWGMLSTTLPGREPPAGTEDRLAQFAVLVGTAIANAESRAELTASRARVVEAADESRRRLQRDVHDGAQQRLVQTIINLKLAMHALEEQPWDGAHLIEESLVHAERARTELSDLVRGILPASLTRGGLRAGVESLCSDLPLPVDVRVTAPRLPPATETTGYFVIAEALANVVKHARATCAWVTATVEHDVLQVEVRDDGVGGAGPGRGSGLTGLFDRVEAREGTLWIESPANRGTTLRAALPVVGE